ncbi:hypothetical protein ABZT28_53195, partial [Streptomyces sp. NPDC005388]|uniref:hypothetical protein n=1 Tax=Streptomyces sp. NPDC005388 TaxID=3156717 RepID=UPI0033BC00EA
RSSAGRPRPRSSRNSYAHYNNPVLQRPVELARYHPVEITTYAVAVVAAILLPVLIAVLVACLSPNADQRGDAYRVLARICSTVEKVFRRGA